MKKARSGAELTIHDGEYRSFEWYWDDDDAMPALDYYESLSRAERRDVLASIIYWGSVPPGETPLRSRINTEHGDPLIVAIKGAKQRFTAFRERRGSTWIVFGWYLKEGQKRDKTGDRVVLRTLKARKHYFERVEDGTYYDRD
jgi:hypothetical protein